MKFAYLLPAMMAALSFTALGQRTDSPSPITVSSIGQEYDEKKMIPTEFDVWGMPLNLHAQSTYINQRYPNFNAPYSGENSLNKNHSMSYTWTGTLFFGARIASNTDLYYNPEVVSGVAFSKLTGLGGLSNAEGNKAIGQTASFYSSRAFLRHTINEDGNPVYLADEANQIAQTVSSQRVVLTAGQFSALDIFDDSRYAKDPRTQFLNWSNLTYLAYDYAADSRGYGWGLAGEWYLGNWVMRAARMTAPKSPNGLAIDWNILKHYGDQIEVERNHTVNELPGKVSLLAYRNKMVLARFEDATNFVIQNHAQGTQAINVVRTNAQYKTGFGVNAEQAINSAMGVYMRAFQSDGKTETMAFAEADNSIAIGMSLNGNAWGRSRDTVGASLMRNGLSNARRQYLEAGGISYFIGDYSAATGQSITYKPEQIAELYYNVSLAKHLLVGLNLQHIQNPAYNAARGPVNILSFRIHGEY